MSTNPIGKGKTSVSASVPDALAERIDRRADKLGWSRSKFVREILLKWESEGAPHINELDLLANAKKKAVKRYRQARPNDPSVNE